jgi:hypothetical protein
VMTATNLIRLQINLKEHVKGEYKSQNTWNGTPGYSAMKSYLEKNTPLFYLLPKFQKAYQDSNLASSPRHASGRYFQQPWGLRLQRHKHEANDSHSNSTQQTHAETLPLFLVTLTRNIKMSIDIQAKEP